MTLSLRVLIYPSNPCVKADLSLIREVDSFLSKISSEEPGTYADYILGLCSDLENAARKNLDRLQQDYPQQQVGGALSNSADIYANENRGRQFESVDLTASGSFEDVGQPTIDPTSSLIMNWQWSIPPFWNWQDIMTSIPSSPVLDVNGQRLENPTFEF